MLRTFLLALALVAAPGCFPTHTLTEEQIVQVQAAEALVLTGWAATILLIEDPEQKAEAVRQYKSAVAVWRLALALFLPLPEPAPTE